MPTEEVISSEELLSFLGDVIEEIEEKGTPEEGLCVGSLDAEALYPSLDIEIGAELCKEKIIQSEMEFEGVDMRWATVYCALNMTQAQINRE